MAKVELYADATGEFEWPKTCIGCGAEESILYEKQTFRGSSPLQLLSIGPWFIFGPAFKTEPSLILVCVALTVIIASAATRRKTVSIPRCPDCASRRKKLRTIAGLSFLIGFILLIGSLVYIAVPGSQYLALSGVSLFVVALIAAMARNFYYGVRLLSANSEVAKFRAPKEVQTVATRL